MADWFTDNGIQTAQQPPPSGGGDWFAQNGIATVASPTFKADNEKDADGNAVVRAAGNAWNALNAPLIPQIADAAHAIADHIDAPALDRSQTEAQIRGFLAGATDAGGKVLASFTSPVGIALTLAGLGPESHLAKTVPALKVLLEIPAVQALQRSVQGVGGAAFVAHGASRVATGETVADQLGGAAEIAAGTLGATSAIRSGRAPAARTPLLTPEEQASNAFAQAHEIPLDAATATGSGIVRGAQKAAGHTFAGSRVAEPFRMRQEAALSRVGGELADQASPTPAQPVEAAEGVRAAVQQKILDHASTADAAYDAVRRAEAQNPAAFTVNILAEKKALQPVYQRLADEAKMTPAAVMGDKARALNALNRLMTGPDAAPLTTVDEVLGDLKGLSRTDVPGMRTQGQGIVAQMVRLLDAKVRAVAQQNGVLGPLTDGRAATVAKYATNDVLDLLRTEPRESFNSLTRQKDAGLVKLRAVQQTVPDQIPNVARGLLEDMFRQASERGADRFEHADRLFADWQKLGPETKQLLFPDPDLRARLDNLFLLAKRMAENPNPSGTAHQAGIAAQAVQAVMDPLHAAMVQFGSYGVAKLLYTPAGVRALTKVLLQSARPSAATLRSAAQAAGWADVVSAARSAGLSAGVPQAAESRETARR